MSLHNILRRGSLVCKQSDRADAAKSREICLASNRRGVLHYNKVLSAGNLILSYLFSWRHGDKIFLLMKCSSCDTALHSK